LSPEGNTTPVTDLECAREAVAGAFGAGAAGVSLEPKPSAEAVPFYPPAEAAEATTSALVPSREIAKPVDALAELMGKVGTDVCGARVEAANTEFALAA
jgi:hypothetical protein